MDFLKFEKTIETIKKYDNGTWEDICDVKRTLEALLNQFQNNYIDNYVNSIKNILLTRITDLSITLDVLKTLPSEVWTMDQIFLDLEIRKNTAMYNYLDSNKKLSEKFKKELEWTYGVGDEYDDFEVAKVKVIPNYFCYGALGDKKLKNGLHIVLRKNWDGNI